MSLKTYLVGGAVRDQLLNIPTKDLDFVIETNNYDEAREYIQSLSCKIVQERPEYKVFRAVHPKLGGLDFALPRKDFNCDGRQAETETVGSIEEDLSRRDFTMNAIAREVEFTKDGLLVCGKYVDPFDGRRDTDNKIIRFVGNPKERIKEDELRVLRALRFAITKNFMLSDETEEVIKRHLVSHKISNERIFEELNKMFAVSNSYTIKTLAHHAQTYLLDRIKLKATT